MSGRSDDDGLRIGLIGAGWASIEHAATIAESGRARIVAVQDLDPRRAQAVAESHGARVFADVTTLLDGQPGLDALIVATPPGAHREATVAGLERGLGVFIEKPLARTREDGLAIVKTAEASGAVCAIGYQWRAVTALQDLDRVLAGSPIGLLVSHGFATTQARPWFYDHSQSARLIGERASHHIDLLRRVAGEVESVQAVLGSVDLSGDRRNAADSVVSLSLSFRSGALGGIHVAWVPADRAPVHRLAVVAESGTYELTLDPVFELKTAGAAFGPPRSDDSPPFQRQLTQFLDAVETSNPAGVYCTPRQAMGSLDVILACEEAAVSGKRVTVDELH